MKEFDKKFSTAAKALEELLVMSQGMQKEVKLFLSHMVVALKEKNLSALEAYEMMKQDRSYALTVGGNIDLDKFDYEQEFYYEFLQVNLKNKLENSLFQLNFVVDKKEKTVKKVQFFAEIS